MSAPPGTPTRAMIDVGGTELHRWVDEAWAALVAANDPRLPRVLVRSGVIVRLSGSGEGLEAITKASMREELSRVAEFGVYAEDPQSHEWVWKPRMPNDKIVDALLSRSLSDLPNAPQVERVIDTPVFLRDDASESGFRLVNEPGYHEAARLIFIPAEGMADVAPWDTSDPEQLQRAWDLIGGELLGDFDYADDASRAHAIAMCLQPFMRDFIDGPTPMYPVLAHSPGSGKGWLVEAALTPSCGRVRMQPGTISDEAEWRKNITAHLLNGPKAIVFDNVDGALSSSTLAAALTTGLWVDRLLGVNKIVELEIQNLWAATGNNLTFTDENARRMAAISLDPGDRMKADERDKKEFTHPDLLDWARANRAELVSACLTMAEHWLRGEHEMVDGGHTLERVGRVVHETSRHLGSFEEWSKVMGGVLKVNNVSGLLGNRETIIAEANEETRELGDFLEAWHQLPDVGALKYTDVAELCRSMGELHDYVPSSARKALRDDHFDQWLKKHYGKRARGFKLVHDEGRPRRWFVVQPGS